ncbi:deoxyuridine triphosphatase [Macacine alphaherpesvirus 1]|uniref:Deoxyuridine triphosphatase n=1 Tax=Cercopithecine herpesvirus 1 TaxID=10325 RepID=Q805X8_CHV1|nr:deoxyuridine triphosphatase [Macacine alphaherpesvirus 1]ARS02871.1 deoxyuridine triphosphatase [Macacine alphaherpesvirus 1]BAC58091.1 deoxyuridine triphosphatase [Macacine alphaherpesvirus 1]
MDSQCSGPAILIAANGATQGSEGDWRVGVAACASSVRLSLANRREVAFTPGSGSASGWAVGRVPLDLRVAMPTDFCAVVHAPPASGAPYRVALGLIDSGYRGTIQAVVLAPAQTRRFAPGELRVDLTFARVSGSPLGLTAPAFLCAGHGLKRARRTEPGAPHANPWLGRGSAARGAGGRGAFVTYTGELREEAPGPGTDGAMESPAFIPKRAEDAGIDIVIHKRVEVPAGGTVAIQPSLRVLLAGEGDEAYYVMGRSSLNSRGVLVTPTRWLPGRQCVFSVHNITGAPVVLEPGSKIAQLLIAGSDALPWVPPDNVPGDGALRAYPRGASPSRPAGAPPTVPCLVFTAEFDAEAPPSERGTGGFGSTGV